MVGPQTEKARWPSCVRVRWTMVIEDRTSETGQRTRQLILYSVQSNAAMHIIGQTIRNNVKHITTHETSSRVGRSFELVLCGCSQWWKLLIADVKKTDENLRSVAKLSWLLCKLTSNIWQTMWYRMGDCNLWPTATIAVFCSVLSVCLPCSYSIAYTVWWLPTLLPPKHANYCKILRKFELTAVQVQRFWYQPKADIQVPISD